jgi:cyclohexa-1,5-dienecarbonyl-CoA hydratase
MTDTATGPSIDVSTAEDGTLLQIRLNRPKGNVLTQAMMRDIGGALDSHRDDAELRLVLLRGTGGHFSFGASIEEHRRDRVGEMLRDFHALARAVAAYPVPVAALVEGRCLGGAFELVLCCHVVFATASARFACPEIKLGVFPPVLAAAGAARLGGALTERLVLTGQEIDAATAGRAGLLAEILDDGPQAEARVLAWHRDTLRPLSAFALREAVAAARRGSGLVTALGAALDDIERQYLDRVVSSHDGNEGIDAYLARRTPAWTNR